MGFHSSPPPACAEQLQLQLGSVSWILLAPILVGGGEQEGQGARKLRNPLSFPLALRRCVHLAPVRAAAVQTAGYSGVLYQRAHPKLSKECLT